MSRYRFWIARCLAIVALAAVVLAPLYGLARANARTGRSRAANTSTAAGRPCAICVNLAWHVVGSPSPDKTGDDLRGMGMISANDIWAVGVNYQTQTKTLAEHWNGSKWSTVTTPNNGTSSNDLEDVSGTSSTDVWAVGSFYDLTSNSSKTLIEHWDGKSWSIVPSQNVEVVEDNSLFGVAAVSATDVWASGYYYNGYYGTLIEHWAPAWSIVPSPNPTQTSALNRIAAVSSTDVWAVGSGVSGGLIEHWDGNAWSVVTTPPGPFAFAGVSARTSSDVWAVGAAGERHVDRALGRYALERHT